MTTQPSATPEPYAHEWRITVKADEHAGAIDALFNCIKAWQSGSEPIGGTCPRSMGNRQTYDVVKVGREARTLETELAALKDAHDTRLHAFEEYKKARDAELARLRAEVENMALQLAKTADRNVALRLDADRLRAEVERLKIDYKDAGKHISLQVARAERAERALAELKAQK